MTTRLSGAIAAVALATSAIALRPSFADLERFAAFGVRPVTLPFAWESLQDSMRHGDAAEAFARAQHVLRLLPTWADGHAAFAYRFVLAPPDNAAPTAERGRRTLQRLELALQWLQDARRFAGRHEPSLLQTMALLPEVAVRLEPALEPLLQARGGAAAFADHYLAEAERLFPRQAIREQRTFYAPRIAAGLLAAGDRAAARQVLATAIERSHSVRDQELAAAWRANLETVVRRLDGDRAVDLAEVQADPRMEPLLPFLR
ncbi:MAG: hypothetical protein JNK15_25495 [Planctomycetes bacterium]|nr:hypothetical protein [Planctomycetota bacterium]